MLIDSPTINQIEEFINSIPTLIYLTQGRETRIINHSQPENGAIILRIIDKIYYNTILSTFISEDEHIMELFEPNFSRLNVPANLTKHNHIWDGPDIIEFHLDSQEELLEVMKQCMLHL
ncbi:hypothetical protein D3C81_904350 [compost metagenome]